MNDKLELVNKTVALAEQAMLEMDQVPCPVIHRFGPGTYIREVTIPAGTFAIGHHQNFEHLNIMLKGRVTILQDDGTTSDLVAPMMFVGKPGRKVGYVHEDLVWLNVYATTETDVDTLESMLVTKSDAWLDSNATKGLARLRSSVDVDDFAKLLQELGTTQEQMRASSCAEGAVPLPFGGYKVKVSASAIEGDGLFATADITAGELIAPTNTSGQMTIASRYVNHSVSPNAKMVLSDNGDVMLVATKNIAGCRGGEVGEEITVSYRDPIHHQSKEDICQLSQQQ